MPVTTDPKISFGRPSINGISITVLVDRFLAGESLDKLADDYYLGSYHVEQAFRFALRCYLSKYGTYAIDPTDIPDASFQEDVERRLDDIEEQILDIRTRVVNLEEAHDRGRT